jgi:hypothetical protein
MLSARERLTHNCVDALKLVVHDQKQKLEEMTRLLDETRQRNQHLEKQLRDAGYSVTDEPAAGLQQAQQRMTNTSTLSMRSPPGSAPVDDIIRLFRHPNSDAEGSLEEMNSRTDPPAYHSPASFTIRSLIHRYFGPFNNQHNTGTQLHHDVVADNSAFGRYTSDSTVAIDSNNRHNATDVPNRDGSRHNGVDSLGSRMASSDRQNIANSSAGGNFQTVSSTDRATQIMVQLPLSGHRQRHDSSAPAQNRISSEIQNISYGHDGARSDSSSYWFDTESDDTPPPSVHLGRSSSVITGDSPSRGEIGDRNLDRQHDDYSDDQSSGDGVGHQPSTPPLPESLHSPVPVSPAYFSTASNSPFSDTREAAWSDPDFNDTQYASSTYYHRLASNTDPESSDGARRSPRFSEGSDRSTLLHNSHDGDFSPRRHRDETRFASQSQYSSHSSSSSPMSAYRDDSRQTSYQSFRTGHSHASSRHHREMSPIPTDDLLYHHHSHSRSSEFSEYWSHNYRSQHNSSLLEANDRHGPSSHHGTPHSPITIDREQILQIWSQYENTHQIFRRSHSPSISPTRSSSGHRSRNQSESSQSLELRHQWRHSLSPSAASDTGTRLLDSDYDETIAEAAAVHSPSNTSSPPRLQRIPSPPILPLHPTPPFHSSSPSLPYTSPFTPHSHRHANFSGRWPNSDAGYYQVSPASSPSDGDRDRYSEISEGPVDARGCRKRRRSYTPESDHTGHKVQRHR